MQHAAELRDEALFNDPPAKEECPICFLPMPLRLISCMTLPSATLSSIPIYDFALANEELAGKLMEQHFPCCGKSICAGCVHSFINSGNMMNCPFCKADHVNKTDEERVEELKKRIEVNDAGAMCVLADQYIEGNEGLNQDQEKAKELWTRAADLGSSQAHYELGVYYHEGGGF